jgi:hypothetical protein
MQSEIDKIVPLDINYSNLDMIFNKEYNLKKSFIEIRSTLYKYERQVLQYPNTKWDIQNEYNTMWAEMNRTLEDANNQIEFRENAINAINENLQSIKGDLVNPPLNQYRYEPFPPDFPYLYTIIPEQSQDPTATSKFAVLKPINFRA